MFHVTVATGVKNIIQIVDVLKQNLSLYCSQEMTVPYFVTNQLIFYPLAKQMNECTNLLDL